jgi:hypothetical protein
MSAVWAAPTSEERKGRSRLPSLVVPSANSTITSPFTSRWASASLTSAVALRRWRSMKTERWSVAIVPTTGQPSISDFAMKERGCSDPITGMSSQETWFDSTIVGARPGGVPRSITRTLKILRSAR